MGKGEAVEGEGERFCEDLLIMVIVLVSIFIKVCIFYITFDVRYTLLDFLILMTLMNLCEIS